MRVVIITDAWAPQVNGVVRTLQATRRELKRHGRQVGIISPDQFRSVACPTYAEIRLALAGRRRVADRIAAFAPDSIHIATEGPLGLAARRACLDRHWRFTTAYHTQFPDYVARRTGLPASWFWRYMKWFHRPSQAILVATPTVAGQLASHGLGQTRPWGRGVDLGGFNPEAAPHPAFGALPQPIQLYVGRVAVEKNIEAFLATHRPGSKVVVGGGPALQRLRRDHPQALFLGPLSGAELASAYASADVFVFPSRTDTFGLVMIEAMACGTPVAAFPVPGPLDVLDEETGAMDEDLDKAIDAALRLDRVRCAARARTFSWMESARQFEAALVPVRGGAATGSLRGRLQLRESGIASSL